MQLASTMRSIASAVPPPAAASTDEAARSSLPCSTGSGVTFLHEEARGDGCSSGLGGCVDGFLRVTFGCDDYRGGGGQGHVSCS